MKTKVNIINPLQSNLPQFPPETIFPGIIVPNTDEQSVPGPGTKKSNEGQMLIATQLGIQTKINQFVTIQNKAEVYRPGVNDVVIGRVASVQYNKWLLDIGSTRYVSLKLDSLNLPGLLRQRTSAEESNMRLFLQKDDLVLVELRQNGQAFTRNQLFGRLSHGLLVQIKPQLAQITQHFININNITLVIGNNGWLWLSARRGPQESAVYDQTQQIFDSSSVVDQQILQDIDQVKQLIIDLSNNNMEITYQQLFDEFEVKRSGRVWVI